MSEKDVGRLKPEHRVVLNALEVANIAHQRVATVSEVIAALSLRDRDARLVKKAYSSKFNLAVGKILAQLRARGLIFSPGVIGKNRYYGSEKALPAESRALPSLASRRRRVLQLVRQTVLTLGRAVRTGEVLDYAAGHPEICNISPELITRDIHTLKATGDLQLTETTARKDNEGKNYYLPSDLDPAEFVASRPLTWMEEVARSFKALWEERAREVAVSNRLPRPISSTELRDHMRTLPQSHPNLRKRMYLVNALSQLSLTETAVVRKIRRPGQRAILWAPSDVPDEQIDQGDVFISDAERIGEAVSRAVRRLDRPVSLKDIGAEVKMDPTLRPAGAASLACVLSNVSKLQKRYHHKGVSFHYSRNLARVFRVGRVCNNAYYYHSAEGLDDAKFFAQVEQVKHRWKDCGAIEQLTALTGCTYPTIRLGRARMIESDAKRTKLNIERLLRTKHGTAEVRNAAESLLDQVCDIYNDIKLRLQDSACLIPEYSFHISLMPQTWTAAELHAFLKPFYPAARAISNPNNFLGLVTSHIRRVPNPNFLSRFSHNSDEAADYLFDRTDALLYAARKWGGHECYFQASLAAFNLGLLRDARFVLPLLSMNEFEDRLAGVACLAFLQTKEAREWLKATVVQDPSPTVREAALWACGFIEGKDANELFTYCQEHDPDARLREFSRIAQQFDTHDWWAYGGIDFRRNVIYDEQERDIIG